MGEKISSTIEDYLGILFISERDGEVITGTRLSELLGVSTPTITNTLKRMVRDGLITMDAAHCPHLTVFGTEQAGKVMRRHMLAEWMLIRMLSWSKVHSEAHGFEHTISDEVEQALMADLNQPLTCPHGNPLPGNEEAVSTWVPLTGLVAGDFVTIRRIHELAEDIPGLLTFLEQKHIEPGQPVKVQEVLPFNQTITLDVMNEQVTLGFATAKYIFVETHQ